MFSTIHWDLQLLDQGECCNQCGLIAFHYAKWWSITCVYWDWLLNVNNNLLLMECGKNFHILERKHLAIRFCPKMVSNYCHLPPTVFASIVWWKSLHKSVTCTKMKNLEYWHGNGRKHVIGASGDSSQNNLGYQYSHNYIKLTNRWEMVVFWMT